MSKGEQRARALRSRRSLARAELASLSGVVTRRLVDLPEFKKARIVASYVAKADEVQTSEVLAATLGAGKRLIVPRAVPSSGTLCFSAISAQSDLSPGHFGVLEPKASASEVPLDEADLVVVPVVSWDEHGNRLGYGKGYFDRALSASRSPLRVGLALEAQRAPAISKSSGDVPLDVIVTEARVLRFGRRKR